MPVSNRPSRRELQKGWPKRGPDHIKQVFGSPSDGGGTERGKRNTRSRQRGEPHVSTHTKEAY